VHLGEAPVLIGVDARIRHGQTGGVESVLTGLAHALSSLEGDDRYLFLTLRGEDDWITPYLGGNASTLPVNERASRIAHRVRPWVDGRIPGAASIARRMLRGGGPPRSDGTMELAGVEVVHFVSQWGFLTEIPSIYHPHDLQHRHLPELFDSVQIAARDRWYTTLARQAAMVAVASSWTRDDVIAQFAIPAAKVHVVPWAPPLEVSTAGQRQSISMAHLNLPDRFILYPAQTWPHKNHAALLHALAILREDGLRVPLVLTGARNIGARAVDVLIGELRLGDQVTWLGFLELPALKAVYRRAAAMVIPSRFEAASGPLWEAFAAGIPAACSNVTSLPMQAGDAALLFDPTDHAQIASAIRRLWTDEALCQLLVARGHKRAAGFTWDRTARLFRAHYRRLAKRRATEEDASLMNAPADI
jgi:glycosyltransferase involved in cell wall biosynthesis